MQKVVLALGDRAAEYYLEERQENYKIVGVTTHRGGVYQQLEHHRAHALVIRDNLPGKEDFLQLIFRIRGEFPDLLIIVLAHGRQTGDPVLAALVNYGVHNILYGDGINLNRVIELLVKPMNYADVQHLQPMVTLNEETDQVSVQSLPEPKQYTSLHDCNEINLTAQPEVQPTPAGAETPAAFYTAAPSLCGTGSFPASASGLGATPAAGSPGVPEPSTVSPANAGGGTLWEKVLQAAPAVAGVQIDKPVRWPVREKVVTRSIRPAVVACWGVTRGVGSSTLALNLAVVLANNGYRTILLELDYELPTIGIWLSLYELDKGMETVLPNPVTINEAVINRQTKLADETGHVSRILKKLPANLELLVFSQAYLVSESTKSPGSHTDLRDLLASLVFQHQYDVVVMDLAPGLDHPLTIAGLKNCSRLLCSVTGDIALLAHSRFALEKLPLRAPEAEKNLQAVINRSVGNAAPDFIELLSRAADYHVPETALLTEAMAQTGLPAVLDGRFIAYREAIENIAAGINPVTITGQASSPGLLKKILGR